MLALSGILGRPKEENLATNAEYRYNSILRGWIAQLVEQRTENPRVPGSIPGPATPPVFMRFGGFIKVKKRQSVIRSVIMSCHFLRCLAM